MAKLEGVKTLDMVGGQITKVEYNGAVYEKVEGDAKAGDLIYTTERDEDTLANEFYEIVLDDRYGGITFFDEADDECVIHMTFYKTFRKVSESALPTIEEVNAKVGIVSEQVSILAERVDALEESKPTTFEEGARVKTLADGQFYGIKSGEVGEVTDIDVGLSDDDPYSIRVGTEDDFDYFRPQDLELVTDGDEVEIVEFNGRKYQNLGTVEAKDGDLVRFKVDHIRTTAGKLYEVINGRYYKDDEGCTHLTVNGWGGKEMREVFRLVEEKSELKVGDYARVINQPGHYQNETIVEIVGDNYCDEYRFDTRNLDGSSGDIHSAKELVKATDEEVKLAKLGRKPGEIKKGDIVRTELYGLLEVDSVVEEDDHPIKLTIKGESDAMMAEGCELIAPVESRVDL